MEKLSVFTETNSPISEAYRTLCTSLLAGHIEKRVIEVVGFAESGSTSLVIANLAVAMAQAGKTVLVVDCNLRAPQQHIIFALQNSGITDCINSNEYYKTFVQATKQSNLFVLTAGSNVANPVEVLLSATLETILIETKKTYDVVLLDVPAVGVVSDAVALAAKTDGVLFVLINKKDRVEQVQNAKEMFDQVGVNVLGCVLDKA